MIQLNKQTYSCIYEDIDKVLSKYGLQIATLYGQFKKPIDITITIEEQEADNDYTKT